MSADGHVEKRQLRILLSEGSSTSARQTLYALGSRHIIDVLDSGHLGQCRFSRYVRGWYRCPSFSKSPIDYLRFLFERLVVERYDVLLPTHEQVYLLARVREGLQRHVGLALPPFEALDQMQSKASFVRTMQQLDLPLPPTHIVQTRAELERHRSYPCYVKLAHSTAGNGVHLIRCADQMQDLARRFQASGLLNGDVDILIQQPAAGTLSVVQTVFQHGRLVGVHCTQALAQGVGGAPTMRVSVSHPIVIEHLKRLGRHLNWHGAMFLEYFYDDATGRLEYIEANPRIGETLNAMVCGVNLCEQLVQVSLDRQVAPLPMGRMGVCSHQSFVILMAAALNGATRRGLLAEWKLAWTRQDTYQKSQDELTRPKEDLLSLIPATAVALQLFTAPRRAMQIVKRTVDNYSLPDAAARAIRELPLDALERSVASAKN